MLESTGLRGCGSLVPLFAVLRGFCSALGSLNLLFSGLGGGMGVGMLDTVRKVTVYNMVPP